MTPEVANMAAQFLQRVTLSPNEIDAFQTVMRSLGEVISGPTSQVPPSANPDE